MKRLFLLLFLPFFVGCVSHHVRPIHPQTPSMDDATLRLSEAASTISHSLSELAELKKASMPPMKPLPDTHLPGLSNQVSINWTGPIESITKKLAEFGHFQFKVLGEAPAVPVIVAIHAHNIPTGDVLRDIDFQAGDQADIVIHPKPGVIELRYHHA